MLKPHHPGELSEMKAISLLCCNICCRTSICECVLLFPVSFSSLARHTVYSFFSPLGGCCVALTVDGWTTTTQHHHLIIVCVIGSHFIIILLQSKISFKINSNAFSKFISTGWVVVYQGILNFIVVCQGNTTSLRTSQYSCYSQAQLITI